jgi:hypothetical protein
MLFPCKLLDVQEHQLVTPKSQCFVVDGMADSLRQGSISQNPTKT